MMKIIAKTAMSPASSPGARSDVPVAKPVIVEMKSAI